MGDITIEARDLAHSFGASTVLRNLNLQVSSGTAALIYGRNGAGKSTLIRLLAGLKTPTYGAALLFGSPSHQLEPSLRQRVGLVGHQSFLYRTLTARENLRFVCDLYGVDNSDHAIASWLDRVGLHAAADEMVRDFSRGMEQRLALARAMITTPDALLMDEPFSSLDRDGATLTAAVIDEALARGCAVVMTAHQPDVLIHGPCAIYELVRGCLMPRSHASASVAQRLVG